MEYNGAIATYLGRYIARIVVLYRLVAFDFLAYSFTHFR
jgi:hypothetical protein